jgi:hypothetical protein
MSRPSLDWKNEAAVRRWLVDVRAAFDDADGITSDMLRPMRERDLGHVQHRKLYGDARKALVELLDYATPPDGEAPVH